MRAVFTSVGAWALTNRRFVRAPIWAYRHHLGWMFGARMLMLEHLGRRSGESRFVCLEVVERPSKQQMVIVSGFGERAQWYRNVSAHPRCFVSTGRDVRVAATARLMDRTESAGALRRYAQGHPAAWGRLRSIIEEAVGHPVTELPMVELHLERGEV